MFIDDLLYFVGSSDNESLLVVEQVEVDVLPLLLHLVEHGLDLVLFGGPLADLANSITML